MKHDTKVLQKLIDDFKAESQYSLVEFISNGCVIRMDDVEGWIEKTDLQKKIFKAMIDEVNSNVSLRKKIIDRAFSKALLDTNGHPLCPSCRTDTVRTMLSNDFKMDSFFPTYEFKKLVWTYRCSKCNKEYIVEGNKEEGFTYRGDI